MRFPVGNTGSKEEFSQFWYDAQPFGASTTYGFHEGADINIRTGGDTDLGQEIKAISSGDIVYYHNASHPTTGFGRHLVYKINGAWGTRWVMCSHLNDGLFGTQNVSEGQIIGHLGKSGTPVAHLHFSVFKVDPSTLRNGIDTIAKNTTELNSWWENPIDFINNWMVVSVPLPVITDQTLIPLGGEWGTMEVQAIRSKLNELKQTNNDLNNSNQGLINKLAQIRNIVA